MLRRAALYAACSDAYVYALRGAPAKVPRKDARYTHARLRYVSPDLPDATMRLSAIQRVLRRYAFGERSDARDTSPCQHMPIRTTRYHAVRYYHVDLISQPPHYHTLRANVDG